MKKNLLKYFLISGLIFYNSKSFAQEVSFLSDRATILEGIAAVYNENYISAEESFREIIVKYPEEPAGYFFMATFYQALMTDWEDNFREKEFYENIKKAISLCEQKLSGTKTGEKENQTDIWSYFFLGSSYESWAIYEARKGGWLKGLRYGMRGKSFLDKAVKIDSAFYEAYFGIGAYNYFRSAYTKSFNWLPFISDLRQKGLEQLNLTYKKGVFSRPAAALSLVWAYIKEKDYEKALDLCAEMEETYPEGKHFIWAEAYAYFEKKDWQKALEAYQLLVERINQKGENYYNLIECSYAIAQCYFNLEKYDLTIQTCEEIVDYPVDKKTAQRQQNKLKDTIKLLKQATGKLTQIAAKEEENKKGKKRKQ